MSTMREIHLVFVFFIVCYKTTHADIADENSHLLKENLFRRSLLENVIRKFAPEDLFEIFTNLPKITLNQLLPAISTEDNLAHKKGVESGDQYRNITELLNKYGYRTETHYIQTEDGYILTNIRIPRNGPPVFLEHGLMSSSDDFVTLGPSKALAYLLSNEGFDVWLGNARGNHHSQQHMNLTIKKDKFWDFSFDEIGRYDLPATIDYILKVTGYTQLFYVGHSQGTTSFFVMCSERPEYNKKVAFMVALSAVAYIGHSTSIGCRLLSPFFQHYNNSKLLLGPSFPSVKLTQLLKTFCIDNFIKSVLCMNFAFMLFGFMNGKTNYQALPAIVGHSPSSTSTKQISHYAQLLESGKFMKFDYKHQNKLVYGSQSPPEYAIEKIAVPMAIFQGSSDWITVNKDLNLLTSRLKNDYEVYNVLDEEFGHLDFMLAKNAPELLYYNVIGFLKNAGSLSKTG